MTALRSRFLRIAAPAIALAATPMLASAGTYLGSGGGAIPDNQPGNPLIITFNVTEVGAVNHVDLTLTGLTHTWIGDLIGTLSGPGGVVNADIMRRIGATTSTGVGDSTNVNGNYRFIDSGVDPVAAVAPLGDAAVLPSGDYWATTLGAATNAGTKVNLDAVFAAVGNAQGTWTLRLSDNAALDTGSITSATLNISTVPEPMSIGAVGMIGAGLLVRRRRS
jgi:subtilisin-like proprotein convertase family protein